MGDWTVLLRYRKPPLGEHAATELCVHCHYIVKEHQVADPDPLDTDIPEFEIEIRYQAGYPGIVIGPTHVRPGWRYTLIWTDARGQKNTEKGYGYDTHGSAKLAAEERTKVIAKSMIPATRYKFTPTLDDD